MALSQGRIDAIIRSDVATESWETIAAKTGRPVAELTARWHQVLKSGLVGPVSRSPLNQAQVDAIIRRDVATESWQTIATKTGRPVAEITKRWHGTLKVASVVPGGDRPSRFPILVREKPMQQLNGRAGDRRPFLHKKVLGFVGGLGIPGISQGAKIARGFFGGNGGAAAPRQLAGAQCPPGFEPDNRGGCAPLPTRPRPGIKPWLERKIPGGETGMVPFGDAVMGQYGAAMEPAVRSTDTRVCPRGAVLGTDGLCYNRRDLRNSERAWPRGRRPLLTGGDMRCISIASAAAKKLQRKQKQLESLGMLKKPARRAASQPSRLVVTGKHAHIEN